MLRNRFYKAHIGNVCFPRVRLTGPRTPIHRLLNLAEKFEISNLWIKRDDLICFGFGGNKIRGLEFLVGDALAQGADTLITGASPLSNHVRAVAAVAARYGLKMVAVYWGNQSEDYSGNYKLVRMLGAQVFFTGSTVRTSVDREMEMLALKLKNSGSIPYVIPRGGASVLGVVGQFLAVREVLKQFATRSIKPDVVVLPVGSGGTIAGWLLGSAWYKAPWRVEGIAVSKPAPESKAEVMRLVRDTEVLLGIKSNLAEDAIIIHDHYIGPGYGIPSLVGSAAIQLTAIHEGVFLYPVYTGKAMAGLSGLRNVQRIKGNEGVLFLHTGGQPGLFVPGQFA